MNITGSQLIAIYPGANIAFVEPLNKYMARYQIDTLPRIAAFLCQSLHESAGYTKLRESLNYKPDRLLAVFGKRIGTLERAKQLVAAGQVAVADAIYRGRYGNKYAGDGFKYRGGGIGHLTFHDNYRDVGLKIGVDLVNHPELIAQPDVAVQTFCQFWVDNDCNRLADKGIDAVSRKVNGGDNGLIERRALFNKALKVLQ